MIYSLTPADDVEVDAPGADAGDESIPLADALTIAIPAGVILDYGGTKFARLAEAAEVGALELVTDPLPTALVAGDVATFGPEVGHALLPEEWIGKPAAFQNAHHELAEYYLELTSPAYTGRTADALTMAIVLQISLQIAQGMPPQIVKSSTDNEHGNFSTAFRDRVIHPGAALIVFRETGKRLAGFTVTAPGV